MIIRNSEEKDLERIREIYSIARQYMRDTGNPDQWAHNHPPDELIVNDVKNKAGYVIVDDDNEIVGVFAFIIGEDETYQKIEGEWLNDEKYGTIHRIASSHKVKHVFEIALNYCESQINNIRIDTHNDNKIMQHKIETNGFKRCGIIYVYGNSPRIAYQKVL